MDTLKDRIIKKAMKNYISMGASPSYALSLACQNYQRYLPSEIRDAHKRVSSLKRTF